ncbi:hypothetical protein NG55_17380 [Acinetobacter gyllenbergii]|nr:hypothetical protein NG55_17380 [Acinetobacter gyllenbergii]
MICSSCRKPENKMSLEDNQDKVGKKFYPVDNPCAATTPCTAIVAVHIQENVGKFLHLFSFV